MTKTYGFTFDCVFERTAKYTEYSNIPSAATCGGSHDKCAPSTDLDILIADGAPGKPGKQVLNADSYKRVLAIVKNYIFIFNV